MIGIGMPISQSKAPRMTCPSVVGHGRTSRRLGSSRVSLAPDRPRVSDAGSGARNRTNAAIAITDTIAVPAARTASRLFSSRAFFARSSRRTARRCRSHSSAASRCNGSSDRVALRATAASPRASNCRKSSGGMLVLVSCASANAPPSKSRRYRQWAHGSGGESRSSR